MTTTAPTTPETTEPDTEAPATIAEITDARLRAVVTALVTAVEELDTDPQQTRTVERAWEEMDDDRPVVIAAAQASIHALDQLAASLGDVVGGGDR